MIFKTFIYDYCDKYSNRTYYEAEVEGLTYSKLGSNAIDIKNELVVFTSDSKDQIIKEIVSCLKSLGFSGKLSINK